jgi:hypothetical protein
MEEARCRALFLALFTPMLTIEGNVPRLRARSAHFVSHLPDFRTLISRLGALEPQRVIVTHMSEDMLERLDTLSCEWAEDGKIIEV